MSNKKEYRLYNKDFWSEENQKFSRRHFRLEKSAKIVNQIAGSRETTLLDLGCGPGTVSQLLRPSISYYGIDIAVRDPAPNLLEADILKSPINFEDKRFDIVLAQGLFEYLGDHQVKKLAEIAQLLNDNGTFVVTYTNFDHRNPQVYEYYSNVQPFDEFRRSLSDQFVIHRVFPTSYNWNHSEPNRRVLKAVNMPMNPTIPAVSSRLAVAYFFICSPRPERDNRGRSDVGSFAAQGAGGRRPDKMVADSRRSSA
jgi:SAM-dependent methyltransferase